jgi:hypothetical protein
MNPQLLNPRLQLTFLEPGSRVHGARLGSSSVSLFATAAFALDPQKAITQFVHSAWTEKEGAPARITALTQTKDRYL